MSHLPAAVSRRIVVQSLVGTSLALAHSLRVRGSKHTLLFLALGLGLPLPSEYITVNVLHLLRHRSQPQLWGVSVGAACGWYNIGYATFTLMEQLLAKRSNPRHLRLLLPLATAATATSLDLLLDVASLDQGLWEWQTDGWYARRIVGPNGHHGVPAINFLGWIGLTYTITLLFLRITEHDLVATEQALAPHKLDSILGVLPLVPYWSTALWWAVQHRQFRYIGYALIVPLGMILLVLRRQRSL